MHKTLLTFLVTGSVSMFLLTACAEDRKDTQAADTQGSTSESAGAAVNGGLSIMDQPVDFSTPENVEKSLQKIREQEGEGAYSTLKNAFDYALLYDLSLGQDKKRLYKKLDGMTPNEIITKLKR